MNENKLFEELRIIKKLLALNVIKEKNLREQVRLLTNVGFSPNEISDITGKNANLIRVTKFGLNNKSEKKEMPKKEIEEPKNE